MINLSFSLYELEFFLLVVVRVTCFVFAAPFFNMPNTPNRVKIALGVFLSLIIYNTMEPYELPYNTVLGYAILVIKEALVGVLIGYGAAICISIVSFAGHLVDMETGLSMVSMFDPVTKQTVTISGSYYQYTILLILMISGLYQYVVAAILQTFSLIPVSGAVLSSEKLLSAMGVFMCDYLIIGFRLCLPVFAATLLLNAILGILSKVSPQLNMFAVGIQLKILTGLTVLFLTVSMLPTASSLILSEVKKMVTLFTEAML